MLALTASAWAQAKSYPLETANGLTLIRAKAEPATHHGKKGLRVTVSDDALRQMNRPMASSIRSC